jgi:xylulokinase
MKWISQKAVCKTVFFYAKIYIVVICGLRVFSKKRVRCPGPESNKRAMRRKEEIMLYIGIDLGTSAVKLLLLSSEGKIVNMVSREYPLSFPHPGWSEQNPADWFEQSMEGVKELLKGQDASQVAGISFGGQMHGLVILDENDNIIRPAILWNDGRTGAETDYLNNEIGKAKLTELTGNIAFPGFTAPKILWVKKNEPENFAKIAKIMLPKDYLAYKLTGVHATDVSDASGMLLFDVKNRTWSKEMCDICGVKESQLAKVFESYESIGTVKADIASELGIPASTIVAAGAGDNAAAAVGTGTVGDNACNISLGTSGTLFISSKNYGVDANNALHSFDHADGTYHIMGCMLSAASCNKWWEDGIIGTKDYAEEQKAITKLGENNTYFLPYLMGERSPHNNPDARGTFIGMTMDTSRADMTQAVLEGVAFAFRDMMEAARSIGINPERSKICGGGAKSPLWRKIMANVLNVKIDILEVEEGPSLGGAMLACVAAGEYKNVEEIAAKVVKVVDTVEPDSELVAKYEKKYQVYKSLYPQCKSLYDNIVAAQ